MGEYVDPLGTGLPHKQYWVRHTGLASFACNVWVNYFLWPGVNQCVL